MKFHETPCPKCQHVGTLIIEEIFYGKPIGEWSLAGAQMKFTGQWRPVLTCLTEACKFICVGRYDGDRHVVFDAA